MMSSMVRGSNSLVKSCYGQDTSDMDTLQDLNGLMSMLSSPHNQVMQLEFQDILPIVLDLRISLPLRGVYENGESRKSQKGL
jgi:hypothetical protein